MTYEKTELLCLQPPTLDDIQGGMPYVFDDHSLAFSLGIRGKTLWWLLRENTLENQLNDKGLYKYMKISKPGGGVREIHEPCEALKNVHKALLETYFNHLESPEHMGAYVKGRDIQFSAKQHVGHAVKLSTDIRNFYGSTRRSWIRRWLASFGYNEWVVKAISNLVVVPTKGHDGRTYSVLPQGAPASSLIANWVAYRKFDQNILSYLDSLEYEGVYTRYSDNVELSFPEDIPHDEMNEIRDKVLTIINSTGYRTRADKTYITRKNSPTYPMQVLGMTTNVKLNIPQQKYRHLRAIVNNCAQEGFDTQYERAGYENVYKMYDSMKGKLEYWKRINPQRIQPLIDQLKEAGKEQGVIL